MPYADSAITRTHRTIVAGLPTVCIRASHYVDTHDLYRLRDEVLDSWTVDRLLNESPVRELLGSQKEITGTDPHQFRREVKLLIELS